MKIEFDEENRKEIQRIARLEIRKTIFNFFRSLDDQVNQDFKEEMEIKK